MAHSRITAYVEDIIQCTFFKKGPTAGGMQTHKYRIKVASITSLHGIVRGKKKTKQQQQQQQTMARKAGKGDTVFLNTGEWADDPIQLTASRQRIL